MKYHNKKTVTDGITFDSKKEARRYCELKLLEKAGAIQELELQKEFELIPAQYEKYPRYNKKGERLSDGKKCIERKCSYVADFVYKENGNLVVEDTKGVKTNEYLIKRKLCLFLLGIKIREV